MKLNGDRVCVWRWHLEVSILRSALWLAAGHDAISRLFNNHHTNVAEDATTFLIDYDWPSILWPCCRTSPWSKIKIWKQMAKGKTCGRCMCILICCHLVIIYSELWIAWSRRRSDISNLIGKTGLFSISDEDPKLIWFSYFHDENGQRFGDLGLDRGVLKLLVFPITMLVIGKPKVFT